jgi:hypothetical protein
VAINWTTVGKDIAQAVSNVVGPAWQNASAGASVQFAEVIAAGEEIEQSQASMTPQDYDDLKLMQQRALAGVLQTYSGISRDVAEQAAATAWGVIVSALKAAYPALAFL